VWTQPSARAWITQYPSAPEAQTPAGCVGGHQIQPLKRKHQQDAWADTSRMRGRCVHQRLHALAQASWREREGVRGRACRGKGMGLPSQTGALSTHGKCKAGQPACSAYARACMHVCTHTLAEHTHPSSGGTPALLTFMRGVVLEGDDGPLPHTQGPLPRPHLEDLVLAYEVACLAGCRQRQS